MAAAIAQMGLGTRVKAITGWVESGTIVHFLKGCDFIFGCTDDHRGLILLNRFSYFYLVPLIDMGLMIQVAKSNPTEIAVLDGRVTVVMPGEVCLLCRKIIDPNRAYAEQMSRNTPDEYEKRKEEAYVLGEGDPSPAVITFTTEVATMALNEFIHRLQGFRGRDGSAAEHWCLFKTGEDRKTGAKAMEGCDLCSTEKYWGTRRYDPVFGSGIKWLTASGTFFEDFQSVAG